MQRHRARNRILAALTAAALTLTALVLAIVDSFTAGAQPTPPVVSASVGASPSGRALPPGFVGVSLEYNGLQSYTGRNPKAVNPVLIKLIENLSQGHSPVLRIGGDSADSTWWPIRHVKPPGGVNYALTPNWIATTKALAGALRSQMIMGVNLAADHPSFAAAEAHALLGGIGRKSIEALEIGNEPDVYGLFPWYQNKHRRWIYSRPHDYSLGTFISQFSRWRSALPSTPVAGPAFAELSWLSGLPQFIGAQRGLRVLTIHRYPLRACFTNPSTPGYPTIPALLSDQSSSGVAQAVAPYVGTTHAHRLMFRVDELNSASCSGKRGVSNTFASALWVLDTMFNLADVGVDGVNIHTLPGAAYELFSFTHRHGRWKAFVHPEYYGMLLFAQAFPPGARLVPVDVSPNGPVKVWATHAGSKTRVVVINKDPSTTYTVQVQVPGFAGAAALERLQAPSASSTNDVQIGGQSFGDETTTGTLTGRPQTQTVVPLLGKYTITVPAASAALLTQ